MKFRTSFLASTIFAATAVVSHSATNLITNGTFDADTTGFNTPAGWTLLTGDVHINDSSSPLGRALDLGTFAASELTTQVVLAAGTSLPTHF